MDKSLILNEIKKHLKFKTDTELANFLGVKQNTISTWKARNTIDYDLIITKCDFINANWLLTGKGEMLKDTQLKASAILDPNEFSKSIPLIPVDAFAGIGDNGGYSISESAIEDRYIIPLFDGKGVDFLISVRGSSMYPKYSSGDIVACRFVRELLFIQWNKVYVLDSKSQGSMIKRLIKSNNPKTVICRSDNKDYGDFEVPMEDIQSIALVVGAIRVE
ncbi:MAG TPA: S24 family peptidase [Moheibacter sp.]|nr:S24 family peptidase [Moheibacter sp.]